MPDDKEILFISIFKIFSLIIHGVSEIANFARPYLRNPWGNKNITSAILKLRL
jgi:hypothetical protein